MEISSLGQLFDYYLIDSVTDEQVERVLAPVLDMIRAGAFDRFGPERQGTLKS
jgi:hypothetical protein